MIRQNSWNKLVGQYVPRRMLTTRARVNEKAYINRDFIKKHEQGSTVSDTIYSSNTLKDALLDHFEYKLEHLLKWEDLNSMCFSIEARVPFLDYRLVERVLATDKNMIIRNGMTKHLLRESMKGKIPEKIRMRRDKIGFGTPEKEWFRTNPWKELIFEILESESFARREIIDTELAISIYRKHLAGNLNVSKEIWKWIYLELWFRKFID